MCPVASAGGFIEFASPVPRQSVLAGVGLPTASRLSVRRVVMRPGGSSTPTRGEKKEQIICSFLAASLGGQSDWKRLNIPLQAYFRWALTNLVNSNIDTWSLSKIGRSFASALILRRLLGS